MKYFRHYLNVAGLQINPSAHRDLNERTNQRPRRAEAAAFLSHSCPISAPPRCLPSFLN